MGMTASLPAPAGTGVSVERWVVALLLALFGAMLLAVLGTALGLVPWAGALVALVLAATAVPWTARRLPREWDGAAQRHRALSVLWLLLALAALARSAGVAWFMIDAQHAQFSAYWFDEFYIRHSCFSGFWKAAELARADVANLYDPEHYFGTEGRFKLDEFLYLPPFLLLPLAGIALGGDFYELRAAWFALEAAVLAGGMFGVAMWIGGATGRRAALLVPALWLATPVVLTLQLGNFHLAAIAMSMLAMVAFERGRNALGGALLGFAGFKLFPGLLGIYLLAARRWHAAAWTVGFMLLYTAVAWVWFGNAPFAAFAEFQLPRIANGDAWAFLENEGLEIVVAINDSIPGLVLKLKMLGVAGMTRGVQNAVSWIWTLLLIVLAVVAARRAPAMSRVERAAVWLALLALAASRSPFLPDHNGLFAPLWLWGLVAAAALPTARNVALLVLAWIALAAVLPFSGMPLPDAMGRLALSTASQAVAVGLCLWVVLRRPAAQAATAAAAASDSSLLSAKVVP